jgi:hypothetical protein
VETDFHRAVSVHWAVLFSNDGAYPARSATFELASGLGVTVPSFTIAKALILWRNVLTAFISGVLAAYEAPSLTGAVAA